MTGRRLRRQWLAGGYSWSWWRWSASKEPATTEERSTNSTLQSGKLHLVYNVSGKMEEKKSPLPPLISENFRFKTPEPILIPGEGQKRRPCSSILLFLLLGAFVFTLGCFAVYTALSVASSKSSASDEITARPLVYEKDLEDLPTPDATPDSKKSKFHIEFTINGNKYTGSGDGKNKTEIVMTNTGKSNEVDEFSTIANFLKKIRGDDRSNIFNPVNEKKFSFEEKRKPKVISIESWEIRKIPKDRPMGIPRSPFDMFNFPGDNFDDIMDSFMPPFQPKVMRPSSTTPKVKEYNRDLVITPIFPNKPPRKDNSFPKTIFSDFEDIISDIFDEKPRNKTKPSPTKAFKRVETYGPFIIPMGSPFMRPLPPVNFKPREEVEVFKPVGKPYLDRYKNNKKSEESGDYDSFVSKLLGLDTIKPKYAQFQRAPVTKPPIQFMSEEVPHIHVYNDFEPKWPKYPKKYQSEAKDGNENLTEYKSSNITTESPVATTPKPVYENINSTTTVAPSTTV